MQFMVEVRLATAPTPEILALLPAETANGERLDAEGIRKHFFLAADQSVGWQVFDVESRDQLERMLASFPLHPYVSATVTQLMEVPSAARPASTTM
jgi:muconolactone delta-isomerase